MLIKSAIIQQIANPIGHITKDKNMFKLYGYDISLELLVAILGIIVPVVSASIGAVIGYFLQRCLIRYQIDRDIEIRAGFDFYMAFDTEIGLLEAAITSDTWNPIYKTTAYDIIKEASIKHEKAIRIFRHHLNCKHHPAFDEAWKQYRCIEAQEAVGDPFLCYASKTGIPDDEKTKRQLAICNIENLLSFKSKL